MGSAKNLALLQNQCKPSQLGKLIIPITGKWYTKVRIIVSNCGNIIFAPEPKFLVIIEEQQAEGNAIRTDEWKAILEELQIGRASFYAMHNKLLGAGLISIKNKEYRLSG